MNEVGKVKWFDDAKGFGFITRNSGDDLFVHYTGIIMTGRRTLSEGQEVSFATKQTDRGLIAVDVTPVNK